MLNLNTSEGQAIVAVMIFISTVGAVALGTTIGMLVAQVIAFNRLGL